MEQSKRSGSLCDAQFDSDDEENSLDTRMVRASVVRAINYLENEERELNEYLARRAAESSASNGYVRYEGENLQTWQANFSIGRCGCCQMTPAGLAHTATAYYAETSHGSSGSTTVGHGTDSNQVASGLPPPVVPYGFACDWPDCKSRFLTFYNLNRHIKNTHMYRFKCNKPDCKERFSSQAELYFHLLAHEDNNQQRTVLL